MVLHVEEIFLYTSIAKNLGCSLLEVIHYPTINGKNDGKIDCKHQCKHIPVCWGCRFHRLLLCRGVRSGFQRVSWYDIKTSDVVDTALDTRGMWSTPSLPLLPGQLWFRVVAPDSVPIYGSYKTNCMCKQMTDVKLCLLYSNTWNHLTVNKKDLKRV